MVDPTVAQLFLQRFSPDARRRGDAMFRGGQVGEVIEEVPGQVYFADVGPDTHWEEVELVLKPSRGWSSACSCGAEELCEHVYAAMCALLAENRTAAVRNLSAGSVGAAAPQVQAAQLGPPDLGRVLAAKLGRPLKSPEKKFLGQVRNCFKRTQQLGYVSRWDFNEMGIPLPDNSFTWGPLDIWPAPPTDEVEFWQYIANAAVSAKVSLPDFMEPITDLASVREKVARWLRAREVQRWKQTLVNLGPVLTAPPAAAPVPADLRFVFEPKGAVLQWKRPGAAEFEPMKNSHLQRLWHEHNRGEASLVDEAQVLWNLLLRQAYAPPSLRLDYASRDAAGIVSRLLRSRQLESRMVTPEGIPLARPAEALKWSVVSAEADEGDYTLQLARADGGPCPALWCVMPGRPTLYLVAGAVYPGPTPVDGVLHTSGPTRIPAPALETAAGVGMLRSLNVDLPSRLSERVRVLPLEVTISASLRAATATRNEECLLRVTARAGDGLHEYFDGFAWHTTPPRGRSAKPDERPPITVYDRSITEVVPSVLESLGPKPEGQPGVLSVRVTRRFAEDFSEWARQVPPAISLKLEGELASLTEAAIAGRVQLEVTETEIDWFDLRVVLDVSDLTLSQEEIRLLLNAKGKFVRLEGKGWRRLQFDLSQDEDERLARLGLNPRELSAEPQRLHALQLADPAAKKFLPDQQAEHIERRASEIKARVAPEVPAGITAALRPYQLEGFHFLAYLSANRFGGILADDMGLGKTLQTLAWLLWLRLEHPGASGRPGAGAGGIPPSLVVCPKSVMDNWHAEAGRFAPGLRVRVWPPGEMDGFTTQLGEADLHVINYAQLRGVGEGLATVRWLAVILDEGQYIKNPSSITAQVARALRSAHRLILSGTPIENRLLDLWSLMSFAMPGVLGSRAQFGRLYDGKGDPLARRRLAARVRPFLIRRTKSQVASDLPDRIEEDLSCEMEGEQKTLYRAELKRAQQILLAVQTQKELADQQFEILVSLLRLRQICCHPRLVVPGSKAPSAKVEALLEQLEPLVEDGQKVLVFSQFVGVLEILRDEIAPLGWKTFYLAGDTEDRGALVREFQSFEGPAIFLISLKAGGFGLNLTAASYVVLFDPWWNPAVENQAIDRTHRIGQTNKVIAYRLLIKDSIEQKIRLLQKKKQSLAEDVLGEERFSQSLTVDDLRFLFAD